jgi:hypothetical protein
MLQLLLLLVLILLLHMAIPPNWVTWKMQLVMGKLLWLLTVV